MQISTALFLKASWSFGHPLANGSCGCEEDMLAETTRTFHGIEQPDAQLIFGSTPGMREIRTKLELALKDDRPVLIEGESGTGKEVVGRFLHRESIRRDGPFVKVNCGAVPSRLLHGEMFSCGDAVSGAAEETKLSVIGIVGGGTLFLDEILDMDLDLQRELTRAIHAGQNKRGRGERRRFPRFVCASSVDLDLEAIQKPTLAQLLGSFGHRVRLLPLRERKRDLPELCEYLADKIARDYGRPVPRLSQSVLDAFSRRNWPGNIRELENWIARIVIFGTEEAMGPEYGRQVGGRIDVPGRRHRATRIKFSHLRRSRRRI